MRIVGLLIMVLVVLSCNKKRAKNSLEYYLETQQSENRADLIACAASLSPLSSDLTYPTDVFFYPIEGATDFRYFECEKLADSSDFSKYFRKELPSEPVFNGYLHRFRNTEFKKERMGVVTYKTPGNIHVCTPIRLKTNIKATEFNGNLLTVEENDTTPTFKWVDGEIKENVIYFQVISDTLGNLISGTYTYEPMFTFYDLSNVVLNITTNPNPTLKQNSRYNVLLMAVSEDNWVNLISEKVFYTK